MSVASPPERTASAGAVLDRPAIQAQPQRVTRRAAPDWLPTIAWFVEDGNRHSRVNVIPTGNTTDPLERFVALLKFYSGAEEPVFTFLSDPFSGDANFRFDGTTLLQALGQSVFEGLVEITARSLDKPPADFPWVDSWMEFYADDETLNGSVPGFVFKGGTTKRVMSGKWQHWPGVTINDDYSSTILLLNYHPRPVETRLDLFAPSGLLTQSLPIAIPPKMPRALNLEECVPGSRELLRRQGGFGSLRVWSAYKLPGFVMMQNRHTGLATSFDHTVPFGGPPIE